jgi:hypothetical protein
VLHLSVCEPWSSGGGKGIADRTQVVEQLAWRPVGGVALLGSRGSQPIRDMKQELTVRIVRAAPCQLIQARGICGTRSRDAAPECR